MAGVLIERQDGQIRPPDKPMVEHFWKSQEKVMGHVYRLDRLREGAGEEHVFCSSSGEAIVNSSLFQTFSCAGVLVWSLKNVICRCNLIHFGVVASMLGLATLRCIPPAAS